MKESTGITRRIDGLGRICIPAEIRSLCGFAVNEEIEMSMNDGVLQIRKYVKREHSLVTLLGKIMDIMEEMIGIKFLITDGYMVLTGNMSWHNKARVKEILYHCRKEVGGVVEETAFHWQGKTYHIFQISLQMYVISLGGIADAALPTVRSYIRIIKELLNWVALCQA